MKVWPRKQVRDKSADVANANEKMLQFHRRISGLQVKKFKYRQKIECKDNSQTVRKHGQTYD